MTVSFAKMDAHLDTNPKVRKAGRNGREVYLFVLRRHRVVGDGAGALSASNIEAWYLADQLMMTEEEAAQGVGKAVAADLLALVRTRPDGTEPDTVVISGWDDEWGKQPMDEAQRKRLQRARSKTTGGETDDVGQESLNGGVETPGTDSKPKVKAPRKKRTRADMPEGAFKCADYLRDKMLKAQPDHRIGLRKWDAEDSQRFEWADQFRLMVEVDKRDYRPICEAIKWVFEGQTSEPRYRMVVQSAESLREKWDRIAEARAKQKTTSGREMQPLELRPL